MDDGEMILMALAGDALDPTGIADSTAAIQRLLDAGERIPPGVYKVRPGALRYSAAGAAANPVSSVLMGPHWHWYRYGPNPAVTTRRFPDARPPRGEDPDNAS